MMPDRRRRRRCCSCSFKSVQGYIVGINQKCCRWAPMLQTKQGKFVCSCLKQERMAMFKWGNIFKWRRWCSKTFISIVPDESVNAWRGFHGEECSNVGFLFRVATLHCVDFLSDRLNMNWLYILIVVSFQIRRKYLLNRFHPFVENVTVPPQAELSDNWADSILQ